MDPANANYYAPLAGLSPTMENPIEVTDSVSSDLSENPRANLRDPLFESQDVVEPHGPTAPAVSQALLDLENNTGYMPQLAYLSKPIPIIEEVSVLSGTADAALSQNQPEGITPAEQVPIRNVGYRPVPAKRTFKVDQLSQDLEDLPETPKQEKAVKPIPSPRPTVFSRKPASGPTLNSPEESPCHPPPFNIATFDNTMSEMGTPYMHGTPTVPTTPGMRGTYQAPQQPFNHAHSPQQESLGPMGHIQELLFKQQQAFLTFQERAEERHQAQMQATQERILSLETSILSSTRVSNSETSVNNGSSRRRHTIFVGKDSKTEYDSEMIERSLYRFKFSLTFAGRRREDIDAFLRSFERAVHSKEKELWILFLDRQLVDQAAAAFQSEFPDLCKAEYSEAVSFLQQRYRPIRHIHDTNISLLQLRQMGSVTRLFNYLDTLLYKLSDLSIEERYDSLLVSMMTAALKPAISKKLLEDSNKIRSGYTMQQLKDDAISVESASSDADSNSAGKLRHKTARAAVLEMRNDDTEGDPAYLAYVADRKATGKVDSEPGKRPAYDHPEWYRRDGNSCRFCKALNHNAATCNRLYRRQNNGRDMPKSLRDANQRILEAPEQ